MTQNGTTLEREPNPLAEAIDHEEQIREEAEAVWEKEEWADHDDLNVFLFRELRPLLRKPIPTGFIEHVGEVTGKPYESTGVRSVQVQMDRLDNVLGPSNWGYRADHTDDGKRCHVTAWIGSEKAPLVKRDSWGGVNRGSSEGNIWKGSFTNAAKLAFARLGPGWEVYVGAADFDPDTDEDAAKAQEAQQLPPDLDLARKLKPEQVEGLERAVTAAGLIDHLPMRLRSFGVESLKDLTVEQAMAVYEWAQQEVAASG